MFMREIYLPVFLTSLIITFSIGCSKINQEELEEQQYNFAAYALISYLIYQDRLPPDPFVFDTPQELYEFVNDPYTMFYNREQSLILLNYWMTTRVGGIGIRLDSVETGYVIKDVFKGSPAETAGLSRGDTITAINSIDIVKASWDKVASLIRGDVGEPIHVTAKRSTQMLSFDLVRSEFNSPSVFIDSLASNISCIYLTEFLEETNIIGGSAKEFKDALDKTTWAEYTIFDLRNNGGGELDQCIEIVSQFVPSGTPVMEFTERILDSNKSKMKTEKTIYQTDSAGSALKRKFVILADSNTASASEILISCLKINRPDIKFIGQHTYGKACGQVLLVGPDSVLAKVTFATLKPVNGTSYDQIGIMPDIAVTSGSAMETAMNLIDSSELAKVRKRSFRSCKLFTDTQRPWTPLLIIKGK